MSKYFAAKVKLFFRTYNFVSYIFVSFSTYTFVSYKVVTYNFVSFLAYNFVSFRYILLKINELSLPPNPKELHKTWVNEM